MEKMLKESGLRAGVAVIGAGNWGSSLAAGVVAAGIPLVEVVVRGGRGVVGKVGGVAPVVWEKAALDAEVLWICVPDGEIAAVAEKIAARRRDLRAQIVVHSSGALTVAALEAVRKAGAAVGGIAPVFSFPTREPVGLVGVMFVVEAGGEVLAQAGAGTLAKAGTKVAGKDGTETSNELGSVLWRRLSGLVRKLGGKPLRIASKQKVLYHAAATMASPLLVSEIHAAVAMAERAGLSAAEAKAVVEVLATASLGNYFTVGSERSFSGPFQRGDAGTVELHLQALEKHPILHDLYRELARHAVGSLPVKNEVGLGRVLDAAGKKRRVRD